MQSNEQIGITALYCRLSRDDKTDFKESKVLTKQLLYQLIDHIEVYETEGTGKNRIQQVVIFWKFVGYIELPECFSQKNYKADTRQGVAVEYPTTALPA